VHRLIRISPFDANHRRQTSFASVDVVPQYEEIDIEIKDEDLRVDTYSAGGPGGQHVNKTQSAVRLTHLPTGVVVQCQSQRSQIMNRKQAMRALASKLHQLEESKRDAEVAKMYGEKGEISFSRQDRSYTMQPYTLVKDERTGVPDRQYPGRARRRDRSVHRSLPPLERAEVLRSPVVAARPVC